MPKPFRRLTHDQSVFLHALLGGLPAVGVSMAFLWGGEITPKTQWTLTLLIGLTWVGFAVSVRSKVSRPLQTMANLLSALREGDFSVRARGARRDEPLGDVLAEINLLGNVLKEQRLGALEATALLRTVMEEIDVAIFAFDASATLRLVNRAGQELLAQPAERILGRVGSEVGLADCLVGDAERVLGTVTFPGASRGRWGMRRTQFREGGLPHHLVVIADLSQPLRDEELKAWQRLVRVLGHELNNSLAPIKSIAGSLGILLKREKRAPDWEQDLQGGLEIIETRADGLARFMQAYARLAKLPAPVLSPCSVPGLIHRIVGLEQRFPIVVTGGPNLMLPCDEAQIEQALINLSKNAVEAVLEQSTSETERPPGVRIGWSKVGAGLEILIEDDGPGIAETNNLFVPFFTTKPEGSGIGLVLCRQIIENHGGSLQLHDRGAARGCIAKVTLPLSAAS